ncbi:MAG TPA: hypothetical protein VF093_07115 [Solirubrobacterales bacterium]
MRLVKMLGLAALTALVAMAFVGASSATATGTTALCKGNEKVCSEGNLVETFHLLNKEGTALNLLSEFVNALCLGLLANTKSLHVGIPQKINSETITFTGCGTSAAHNNCTIEFKKVPTFTLLKTAENLGLLTAANGELLFKCTVLGITKIDCTYDTSGLEFGVEGALHQTGTGHGMVTAASVPLAKGSGAKCPEKPSTLEFLLEPLEHAYVAGVGNQSTALCKVHQEPCQESNLVTSLHTETKNPLVIVEYLGTKYYTFCEKSLATASVGELGAPQEITIEELTWTKCITTGGQSCTIKSLENAVLYLYKIGLNVGEATSSKNEIEVDCPNPGFNCVFASEPKLRIEGANHTAGSGNGMFEANEPELENIEGDCEGPGFQYGLYEPLTSVNVVS